LIVENLFYPLLSFLPALLNVGILIYVFFFVPKGKTTDIFSFFVFALLLWQIEDTIVRLCDTMETARYWDRILCIGWAGFAPIAVHFACRYSSLKAFYSRFALTCIYLPFVVFYIAYMSSNIPSIFKYSNEWGWVNTPRIGTLDEIQRLFISIYVFVAVFILFRHAFKVRNDKGKRLQAFLIAAGMFVPTVQGVVTQIIYPIILDKPEIPVTSSFMTFFSLATIISIRKYKLFNISESIEVETVLQNLRNIVFVVSPKYEIIYMNPFARKMFLGTTNKDEIIHVKAIFPSSLLYDAFASEVLTESLKGERAKNFTTAFQTISGNKIDVMLSAEPISNNKQIQGLLLVANDVTELLKTVTELEASNKELERYAYVASHDLQEPLRKVSLFLQLLESRYKSNIDDTAKNYIDSAVNGARQMRQLIRDLLEYSHIGTTKDKVEAVNMREVTEQAMQILEKEIQETEAIIEFGDLPVLQKTNITQMIQLMQNLISNALKYRSDEKPIIKITAKEENGMSHFSIKDNGIGFDPEFKDKVFVIFKRLHNKHEYPGTGIGLSICKKIVEQHGGKIWVDSQEGKGSTFHFTLPVGKTSLTSTSLAGSQSRSFVV
jgi:signal transduction histidine kinase